MNGTQSHNLGIRKLFGNTWVNKEIIYLNMVHLTIILLTQSSQNRMAK